MSYSDYKNKILRFYKSNKRMPGYKEIMDMLGYKSKNAVFKLINKLVEEGIVEKDSQGKLRPAKLFGEVPMLGLVEAGIPTTADEIPDTMMSFDDYLVEKQDSTFVLEVKGDSMIDAGIHEGDLVIAERTTREPKEREIVVAFIDGGWTMKYFRKKNGRPYLEPANKKYENIYPEYDLKIGAIVKGVVRKY